MQLIPLKTGRVLPGDDLLAALRNALRVNSQTLQKKDIVVIASKVVAYSENRLVPVESAEELEAEVRKEADLVAAEGEMTITLKHHVLIPNAGIDQSNTPSGKAILWPADPFKSAQQLCAALKKQWSLSDLGVVISDSHCSPLRLGTTGIAIGWAGFEGIEDKRGDKDLYGKPMKYTRVAVCDDLASAANILMGETNASVPFVIVRDCPATFTESLYTSKDAYVPPAECIFAGVYSEAFKKKLG